MSVNKPKRVILSRKGFDSSAGGIASPIMPDGTLLSMPIPVMDDVDYATYGSLTYESPTFKERAYADILSDLYGDPWICGPNAGCHADPDIRKNARKEQLDAWRPAFGPRGTEKKGVLKDVSEGDLFLFFGWFRQVKCNDGGRLEYGVVGENDKRVEVKKRGSNVARDLHVIHSYMQVGEVLEGKKLEDQERIKAEYYWHPHSRNDRIENGLYLPSDCLWFDPDRPGCGVLDYSDRRVLTADGKSRAKWEPRAFLMPDKLAETSRKNSGEKDELYYAGQWQELVFSVEGNEDILAWAKEVITS